MPKEYKSLCIAEALDLMGSDDEKTKRRNRYARRVQARRARRIQQEV